MTAPASFRIWRAASAASYFLLLPLLLALMERVKESLKTPSVCVRLAIAIGVLPAADPFHLFSELLPDPPSSYADCLCLEDLETAECPEAMVAE